MARPAQRKKIRNPNTKITRHVANRRHRRRPIANHETIAGAWDNTKTVKENYKAMGLALHVNSIVASSQVNGNTTATLITNQGMTVPITDLSASLRTGTLVQLGQIKRDSDNNVISVTADEMDPLENSFNDVLDKSKADRPRTEVVKRLEKLEASAVKRKGYMSEQEGLWISQLIAKHKDNVIKMAQDMKLNSFQLTPCQISKKIEKYHRHGGALARA